MAWLFETTRDANIGTSENFFLHTTVCRKMGFTNEMLHFHHALIKAKLHLKIVNKQLQNVSKFPLYQCQTFDIHQEIFHFKLCDRKIQQLYST